MNRLLTILILVALTGCVASSKKLADLQIGMTRADVVSILGTPSSVSAHEDGTELLRYQLRGKGPLLARPDGRIATGYTVQIRNGKVIAYGRDDEFRRVEVKTK